MPNLFKLWLRFDLSLFATRLVFRVRRNLRKTLFLATSYRTASYSLMVFGLFNTMLLMGLYCPGEEALKAHLNS